MSGSTDTLPPAVGTVPAVIMGDPGNFTPYYIDSLCRSLADLGVPARVVSSPPLFEPVDPEGQVYALSVALFKAPAWQSVIKENEA